MDTLNDDHVAETSSELPEEARPKLRRKQSYTLKTPVCTVYVEWLLGAVFFSTLGAFPLIEQYIYIRSAKDYPILVNHTENSSISEACAQINSTDNEIYNATQAIQAKTSDIMMYLSICRSVPSIFSTLIISGYSDKLYRKPALYLPTFGLAVQLIVVTCVVYFELHIYLLFIGYFVYGCTGGVATTMAASFAYLADVVHPNNRAFRMVFVDVVIALSGAAAESLLGFLIKHYGFLLPSLIIVTVAVLALLYSIFIIPETHEPLPDVTFSLKESLMATYEVYARPDPRRPKLFLLIAIMLFPQLTLLGSQAVSTLYQMNSPLCWGPALIGVYLSAALFILQIGSFAGSVIFVKCLKFPDIVVCMIGDLSGLAAYVFYSICTQTWQVFIVPVVAMFELLTVPMSRAIGSKLVDASEQGGLFSGMGVVFTVANIVSSVLFNKIYNATLDLFHGTVFLVCAGCFVTSLFFTIVYVIHDKRTGYIRLKYIHGIDSETQ